jgi:hypothetical protein
MKPLRTPRRSRVERAIDRDRIDTLRRLAKEAEGIERRRWSLRFKVDAFFTCTRVADALGHNFADEYQDRFVPDEGVDSSECDLWNDPLCMSRRILSLCFMAAMVEAGDA